MHLPAPLRAAVGLVASAADEARHLPDRAIELPMLAVSTALQLSLRAQQRYAMLAARGERVLNRSQPTDDPPPWATFDEPVSADELRQAALAQLDGLADTGETSRVFEDLFGVSDPAAPAAPAAPSAPADSEDDTVTPIAKAAAETPPAKKSPGAKKTSAAKKSPAKKTSGAKRTSAAASRSTARSKNVNKPRHTAPSKFDDATDD